MGIDYKQYVIGILHIDCKVNLEDIDYAKVDDILYEMQNDANSRNSEFVKSVYFKQKVTLTSDTSDISTPTEIPIDEPVATLVDPPAVVDISETPKNSTSNNPPISQSGKVVPGKQINLPNGKVNEPYSEIIPLRNNGLENIEIIAIKGMEQVGLQLDKDSATLSGLPNASGDCILTMEYKIKGDTGNKPILQRNLIIYINPDPRSLWTEHEPDVDLPFPKPHTDNREFQYADKKVVGASKRGRSHAKDGKFRDDHFEIYQKDDSDWLILTVSDGAGSAKLSREGSKIFCQTFTSEMLSMDNKIHFDEIENIIVQDQTEKRERDIRTKLYYLIGSALVKAFKEVEESSKGCNAVVKDYSCTFLTAICKKIGPKWFIAGYWVGDGGIGIFEEGKEPVILGQPDSGEFSGQTRFITMPEMLNSAEEIFNRIKIYEVEDFKFLALMTDGISDAWFHTDANLFKKEKWEILWSEITKNQTPNEPLSSIALLEWLDFWVKGEYDDRTIVIVS
jgi:hypothetical protein